MGAVRLGADGPADPREETNAHGPGHIFIDTPPGGARRKAARELEGDDTPCQLVDTGLLAWVDKSAVQPSVLPDGITE